MLNENLKHEGDLPNHKSSLKGRFSGDLFWGNEHENHKNNSFSGELSLKSQCYVMVWNVSILPFVGQNVPQNGLLTSEHSAKNITFSTL